MNTRLATPKRWLQRPAILFCNRCGSAVTYQIPEDGDTKIRAICSAQQCAKIQYENPLNVVGTIPYLYKNGTYSILLCKRNIEPRRGKWTLPAGFMELGETAAQGAERETQEEAGAQIEMQPLFTLLSVPGVAQVHFFYRALLLSEQFDPGTETLEARLFTEDELPWDEIAFRTVTATIQHFFEDAKIGVFHFHEKDLVA